MRQNKNSVGFVYVLLVLWAFHLLADALSKAGIRHALEVPNFSGELKITIAIIIIGYGFIKLVPTESRTQQILFYMAVLAFTLANTIELNKGSVTTLRYAYPLIIFPILPHLLDQQTIKPFFKFLKTAVVINFFFVLLGLLFEIDLFKTYSGSRFGYNGLILNQLQTPYFYLAGIFVAYKMGDWIMLVMAIICSLLAGVKSLYLACFLFSIMAIVFSFRKGKGKQKIYFILLSVLSILGVIGLFKTEMFKKLIEEHGMISVIFSFRNQRLAHAWSEANFDLHGVMFGGINNFDLRPEMDFIDIFFLFGLTGLLLYGYVALNFFKSVFNNLLSGFFLVIICIISILNGYLLFVPFNCLMLFFSFWFLSGFTQGKTKMN